MDVSISARHVNITPRLEEVIHEKIGGLDKFLQGLDHAEVHFDEARNPRITDKEFCEVVVEGHGHHLRCKVHAPDPFSAVDAATLKLERQIRKLRTRLQKRHHGAGETLRHLDAAALLDDLGSAAVDDASEGDAEADDVVPAIVKSKRFFLAPMNAEDAVLKMDLLGHGFFFFINAETNRSAVVYKRDDGDVGLIDEAG
ncbi:MAG: ribosome-associated translation inhibitor RaiA [Acidimicrobiales bacterium]|nr:ribosome-associated translation inhibitor RaiA [Acidimicrobiales bacterium]MDG1878315.1 ribosome-associated translation inhibitor RaiA [Acidimicrobiales bacterium]